MAQAGLISQLRAIAAAVEVLPEVRDSMATLGSNVETMVDEVTLMRKGVDKLSVEVAELNANTAPLDARFIEMLEDIKRLDKHLKEVRLSLAPLNRAVGGLGNLGDRLRGNRQQPE